MKKNTFLSINDKLAQLSTSDLIEILNKGIFLKKAKAFYFLAQRCGENEELINLVTEQVFAPLNKQTKVIVTLSVSLFGIAGLLEANTLKIKKNIDDFA
jgi:hypothetical protein